MLREVCIDFGPTTTNPNKICVFRITTTTPKATTTAWSISIPLRRLYKYFVFQKQSSKLCPGAVPYGRPKKYPLDRVRNGYEYGSQSAPYRIVSKGDSTWVIRVRICLRNDRGFVPFHSVSSHPIAIVSFRLQKNHPLLACWSLPLCFASLHFTSRR